MNCNFADNKTSNVYDSSLERMLVNFDHNYDLSVTWF